MNMKIELEEIKDTQNKILKLLTKTQIHPCLVWILRLNCCFNFPFPSQVEEQQVIA